MFQPKGVIPSSVLMIFAIKPKLSYFCVVQQTSEEGDIGLFITLVPKVL